MDLQLTPLRTSIDAYVAGGFIGELSGVSIFDLRDSARDHAAALNCLTYAMRKFGTLEWDFFSHECAICAKGFQQVTDPHATDLAIYIQCASCLPEQVHAGIVRPNNLVESKWGYEHVMLHDFAAVPTYYGDKLLFFRK